MENQPAKDEANSLEGPEVTPESGAGGPPEEKSSEPKPKGGIGNRIRGLISHLNIYLLIFVLIVVITLGFTLVSIQRNKKESAPTTIQTTTLTQDEINKLTATDSTVGDAKQTLSVESNAIFSGKVLIRDSLDVAGTIKVGGPLSLSGLTVAGTATLDQIQGNKLTIAGDTNIQGQLTAQKGITVTGGASFGGPISAPQITVQSFQLTGDLQINRHIDAGGATPGKSDGGALGSGGTVSVSGTDTAGTITINTGGSPGAGCFVTVQFAQRFNATPHVVVTPIGSGASGINYYVNRSSTDFSVCTTNGAPGGTNFSFDWVAVD